MNDLKSQRQWSSQFAFLMATVGSAVGLGNLWRFPFQAGENGGAAFVFIYVLAIILIVYPVMLAEMAIGRNKKMSAVGSTKQMAVEAGRSPLWGGVGLVGAIASYMVLTVYSVIAGQIMAFSAMSFLGMLAADNQAGLPLYQDNTQKIFWHSLFLGATTLIVLQDLKGGIERITTYAMPLFFIILAALAGYALFSGAASEAISYLFRPRFSELTPQVLLAALGQAFFSLNVGAAAVLTYSAFLRRDDSLVGNGVAIASADTIVALMAGLMIFPIVFAYGLDPGAGMGLIFDALPAVFSELPFGTFIGGGFFFLAFIAAITSAIAMLFVTSYIVEEQFGLNQKLTVSLLGLTAWAIGVVNILVPGVSDQIDFLAGQFALPIGGMLVSIFAGWIAPKVIMQDELSGLNAIGFKIWLIAIRFLCPLFIGIVLVFGLL